MDRRLPSDDTFEKLPRGRNTPLPPRPPLIPPEKLEELKATQAKRRWSFWTIALTFVWAFGLNFFLSRSTLHFNNWIVLLPYPGVCGVAAVLLWRRKRALKGVFAVLNLTAGLAWGLLVYWFQLGLAEPLP